MIDVLNVVTNNHPESQDFPWWITALCAVVVIVWLVRLVTK